MSIIRSAALLGCASFLAISTSALAQGSAPVDEESIVVTGSRVVRNGDAMPTPTTVVSVEQMADVSPTTVADQLNLLPQFAGSQGQTTQGQSGSANAGNPNTQGNVLNLRNFGFNRNLVLSDGHRVAPNSPNGTVDIDMIPQMLLKRVDVVTGGASAVYGADAVSGVINFVNDTGFTGVKAHAQAGISTEGDGKQKDIGVAWGTKLGERGHFMASYQYRNDDGIDKRSSRAWGATRYQLGQVGGVVGGVTTYRLVTGATRQGASFGGTIGTVGAPANPLNLFQFTAPGVVAPVTGDFVNTNVLGNGSGSYFDPSLKGALEMHQAFARFDYDLTDGINFYARGAFTDTTNSAYAISNPTYQASNGSNVHAVFVTNPFLPASIASLMTANGTNGITRFGINRVFGGAGQDQYRQFTQAFGRNWSVDLGLQGDFGAWKWEIAYIHSNNRQRVAQNNAINGRKLGAALDAVIPVGGGTPTCYVTTQAATASQYQGCVPLANIFGGALTPAEADWIFDPLQVTTNTRMNDVEAFISGSPFDTWAGPVNVAISGQARKQSYEVISSSSPATLANPLSCTNLRLITCGPTSLEYFQAESFSRPQISVSVKELAMEADVPLLKDSSIAKSLSVSGAVRLTDYSNSGSVWSWKGGLNWQVTDDLTFRATRSRDIRAPTMHEMFQPQVIGNFNGTDVLLGVALDGAAGRPLPAGTIASGNAGLRPEKANTLTAGVIYRPSWAPGLSFAIDYFDIKVSDAIVLLDGSLAGTQTDCNNSGGASETCSLIVRAGPSTNCATGGTAVFNNCITRTFARPINIGRQFTRGVDFEMNYGGDLFSRPFQFRLLASYQPKNVLVDAISGVQTNYAGAGAGAVAGLGHAKWRGTMMLAMEVAENLKVTLFERYRGPMDWFPTFVGAGAPNYAIQGAPANIPGRFYTNLNVAYDVGPAELFLNVQNLFNTAPAPYANFTSGLPGNNGVAPGDDPIGRYFVTGVRLKF